MLPSSWTEDSSSSLATLDHKIASSLLASGSQNIPVVLLCRVVSITTSSNARMKFASHILCGKRLLQRFKTQLSIPLSFGCFVPQALQRLDSCRVGLLNLLYEVQLRGKSLQHPCLVVVIFGWRQGG